MFDPPTGDPRWFIIFHELGHNNSLGHRNTMFCDLLCGLPAWVESEASLLAFWSMNQISISNEVGVSARDSVSTLAQESLENLMNDSKGQLADYETSGSAWELEGSFNGNHWNGLHFTIIEEYGWDFAIRYVRAWRHDDTVRALMGLDSDSPTAEEQATFQAAAISAAVEEDLRQRFIDQWRFPINDGLFTDLYDHLIATMSDPWADPL